ncbi:MAG TPA: ATP-binding protein [Actinomycetota bacterium]|nr:ATP-binding protein [Actinomycetota bacterium]
MSERSQPIAFAAAVAEIVLLVATAVLLAIDGFAPDPVSNVVALLAIGCYAIVGGLIAARLPRNACGWLLLLIGLGLVVSMAAEVASTIAKDDGRIDAAAWTLWLNSWFLVATAWPGIVLYLLTFPTGMPPTSGWRRYAVGVIVLAVVGVLVRMVQPWPSEEGLVNPVAVSGASSVAGTAFTAVALAFALAGIVAVGSLVIRFRRAGPSERRAMRWLAVVGVLAAATLVMAIGASVLGQHAVGDVLGATFLLLLIAGIPASAAGALLTHRIHGIEVVANRSVVYASLASAITVIYAVVVGTVGAVAGGGDRPNVVAAVAATVLAAVAFQPARRQAQRFSDRLVYGDRTSPYELVATFTERLDDASLHDVLPRMAELIASGVGAARVTIWLRSDGELRPAADWPAGGRLPHAVVLEGGDVPAMDDLTFRVAHGGRLLGAITVVMPPAEPTTPAVERSLRAVSTQAGLVMRNVALVQELQGSRQRLVASEDEARRRLERDLHDGAQQRLVTLSMDLRGARSHAEAAGDHELTTRLEGAERELARSLGELRELARGIHPAILTQSGVAAAVRSLAERSTVAVELGPMPQGRFPPDIEATAYFVVSEALANVAKHAAASHAWVSVDDGDGVLSIEVRDDGIGGVDLGRGSGLRGLADRVEAVGGRIDVRSDPGRGSTVHAEIPCASR